MPESDGFQANLVAAIEAKRAFLEQKTLAELKQSFAIFQSLFENLYNILLRKSLIQEDPYKYEQKISEVTPPPKGEIHETERQEKLSQRLSEFHTQLEFLNNYYQFSLEFLTLDRLKRIIGLLQYINWLRVAETSSDQTTAILAEALSKIRLGSDNLSIRIISTSLAQMQTRCRQLLIMLKELLSFQRQAYKSMIRQKLLPPLAATLPGLYAGDPQQAYLQVRRSFVQELRSTPFYRDLIVEILNEEYGQEGAELREQALSSLKIPEEQPEKKAEKPDYRRILLEAIRLMLPAGGHLNDILNKIQANQGLLEKSRQGLGGKLRAWLQKAVQGRDSSRAVEVRYFDSRTSSTQSEILDLDAFIGNLRRKIALFASLGAPESPSSSRLAQAAEEQLHDLLKKNLGELELAHRRVEGLSDYFRRSAGGEDRNRIKGTRIELSALKNCIVRANRKRYEYVSLKEEEEQLRKLGFQRSVTA